MAAKKEPTLKPYSEFLEEVNRTPNEFGTPRWGGVFQHLMDDGSVILSYYGNRIVEITPDNRHFLYLPPSGYVDVSARGRWQHAFNNLQFHTVRRKRANGHVEFKVTSQKWNDKAKNRYNSWEDFCTITARRRVEVHEGGALTCADTEDVTVTKDNAKYRAFCTGLKKLKAVMTTKARMGVYDQFGNFSTLSAAITALRPRVAKLHDMKKDDYLHQGHYTKLADALVQAWILSEEPKIIDEIAVTYMHIHSSMAAETTEDLRRRLVNGLRGTQVRYLQKECVTITESAPSKKDSDDSNVELQQNDGLREVQVPRQAEVHRPDPGASEAASAG